MSVSAQIDLSVDVSGLTRALDRLEAYHLDHVADRIGAMIAANTVDRLDSGKAGPQGETWPAWSDGYARTRHGNQSLLVASGDMRESIEHQLYGSGEDLLIGVGVHMIQGATHQFGDSSRGIPARPYLGLSDDERSRIEELVVGDLSTMFE